MPKLELPGFVVESTVEALERSGDGPVTVVHTGTARVWVGSEERAKQIVREGLEASPPVHRTYREVAVAEMPAFARENLLLSRQAGAS